MPTKPKKPCFYQLCPELVESGEVYCEEHKKVIGKRDANKRTDEKEQKFYKSYTWKRLREQKLNKNSLCEMCLKEGKTIKAEIVHHITDLRKGGSKLSIDNLVSVCFSCHEKIHKRGRVNK